MTMDRHDTIGAMLDEYALGQLSQDERRDVETHVRECDVCAADLRELTIVMEGLAHRRGHAAARAQAASPLFAGDAAARAAAHLRRREGRHAASKRR